MRARAASSPPTASANSGPEGGLTEQHTVVLYAGWLRFRSDGGTVRPGHPPPGKVSLVVEAENAVQDSRMLGPWRQTTRTSVTFGLLGTANLAADSMAVRVPPAVANNGAHSVPWTKGATR